MPASVRRAQNFDLDQLAHMCALLWPDAPASEHRRELESLLHSGRSGTLPLAIFVAHEGEELLGFVEVGLRSHADGCDPQRPVGFVEGWFVHEAFRHRGVGKQLMRAAEDWSRAQGCAEIASDTWLDHADSQRAHEALGFEVVDRCVHYRKPLAESESPTSADSRGSA
jgi:aminoglycoside 6'-N-acetyltransferase I